MARLTPQEAAAKLVQRASAATGDYQAGVMRVSRAPGEAAAASANRMLAGVQQAVQSGRWANRVRSVSLGEWQRQTSEKGAARYAQGVQAAQGKIEQRMAQLLPMVDSAAAKARSMPADTKEQRIQRSVAFQQAMTKLGGRS